MPELTAEVLARIDENAAKRVADLESTIEDFSSLSATELYCVKMSFGLAMIDIVVHVLSEVED